jgi:flagellar secretion chaperone FliS
MSHRNPAESYQMDAARAATPVGGVVALYETIVRDFRRASAAIAAGNVEARVTQLNHALTVIAELQGVLDFERGGIAARRFLRFYEITRGLIMEANIRGTQESLQELIALYSPVCQAWKTIDQRVPAGEFRQPRCNGAPMETVPSAEPAPTGGRWNA